MSRPEAYLSGSPEKRAFDVMGSFFLAAVLGVPAAAGALAIKGIEHQEIIFPHKRYSRGVKFAMYKLQTMHAGSEHNEIHHVSLAADVRLTRVGKILRRFDLDEVPQLWNVLRGDMNLFGSRPNTDKANERLHDSDTILYADWIELYPEYKTGIVGPGQLEQRETFRHEGAQAADRARMRADIHYWTETASPATDLRIMTALPLEFIRHIVTGVA